MVALRGRLPDGDELLQVAASWIPVAVTPLVECGTVKTKELGESKLLNLLFKPAGLLMGSRLRQWLMDPVKTLGEE